MNADQFRMALAAIDMPAYKLSAVLDIDPKTPGKIATSPTVKRESAARKKIRQFLEDQGVRFVSPGEDHAGGVLLALGFKPRNWKNGADDLKPTDEGGAQLLEYWRGRPEEWRDLPDAARAAMLVAIYGSEPDSDPIPVPLQTKSPQQG